MRSFDFRICFLQLWARHIFSWEFKFWMWSLVSLAGPLMVAPRSWRTFTGEPLKVLPLSLSRSLSQASLPHGYSSQSPLPRLSLSLKVLFLPKSSLSQGSLPQGSLSQIFRSQGSLSLFLSLCFFLYGSLSQDPLPLKRLSLSRSLSLTLSLFLSHSLSLFPALSLSLSLSLSLPLSLKVFCLKVFLSISKSLNKLLKASQNPSKSLKGQE